MDAAAKARGERGSADQALDAVAVKRAGSGERVARRAAQAEVAEFGVERTVDRAAVDDDPATDPGADGQIDQARTALPRTPAVFGERGGVDVGIDGDRTGDGAGQHLAHPRTAPAGLGGGQDAAIVGCGGIEPDRAEAGDAQPGEAIAQRMPGQPVCQRAQGLFGVGCGDPMPLDYFAVAPDQRDTLGSAQFDPGKHTVLGRGSISHPPASPARRKIATAQAGRRCR